MITNSCRELLRLTAPVIAPRGPAAVAAFWFAVELLNPPESMGTTPEAAKMTPLMIGAAIRLPSCWIPADEKTVLPALSDIRHPRKWVLPKIPSLTEYALLPSRVLS